MVGCSRTRRRHRMRRTWRSRGSAAASWHTPCRHRAHHDVTCPRRAQPPCLPCPCPRRLNPPWRQSMLRAGPRPGRRHPPPRSVFVMQTEASPALRHAVDQLSGASIEAPGLIRVPLPTPTLPPATTTNHWIVGHRRAVLVDPATPHPAARDRLCGLLAALNRLGTPIGGLLLTHHHDDHVGAALDLRRRLDLPVLAHPATAERLRGRIPVDIEVHDGQVVAEDADGTTWTALHTPGHAPGHLVLAHSRSGVVVAGDLVAGEGTILIDPRDGRMADYLASLTRVAALKPTLLAPAHGPVLTDAVGVLAHYRRHRLQREARIAAALPANWTAPDALLPAAYGDVSRLLWPIALRSLLAHLEHLREQGRATEQAGRWRAAAGPDEAADPHEFDA
ncbi:MAG: MBL fold metallo-hydrolase [Myxococcales bacterium]|nr:MBL fold metallo-hydrolase [Myxococcales bacterium]